MQRPINRLDPAAALISKCGGAKIVAEWLGISEHSVARWQMTKDAHGNGTNGLIPQRYHVKLIRKASEVGIQIDPIELFPSIDEIDGT